MKLVIGLAKGNLNFLKEELVGLMTNKEITEKNLLSLNEKIKQTHADIAEIEEFLRKEQ